MDVVASAGEADVLGNLNRKAEAADRMFAMLVEHMREAVSIARPVERVEPVTLPAWV